VKRIKEIHSVVVNHVCLSTYSWELSSNGVSRNSSWKHFPDGTIGTVNYSVFHGEIR